MVVSALALTAALTPVTLTAAFAAEIDQLLEEARTFKADGRIADSIIQIKNALQQEPANAEANALLGTVYLDTGDVQRGQMQLERARDLGGEADLWMVPLMRAWQATGNSDKVLSLTDTLPETLPARLRADALALRGRVLAVNGDTEGARDTFETARRLDPGAALPPAGLARLELAQGNPDAAIPLAKEALANGPEDPDVLYLAGDLALAQGDMAAALEHYGKIRDLRPENPFVRVPLARALVEADRLDDAADELDWVLKRVSNYPEALHLRAHVAYRQGKLEDADRLISRALSVSPTDPALQTLAGLVKYRLGEHEQAVRLLSGVAENTDAPAQARMALGAALLYTEQAERAYSVLKPIVPQMTGDVEALALMGEAARLSGHNEEALTYLREANALSPDDARILRQISAARSKLGQEEAGMQALGEAVEKDPGNEQAVSTYYAMLLQNNMPDQALAVAARVIEAAPQDSRGYTMRGLVLVTKKDMEGAEAAFRKALEVNPAAADAAGNLSSLLRMEQREDEAERILLDAHKASPKSTDLMLRLGDIAVARGDKDGARTWLQQAVEAGVSEARPRAALGALLLTEGRADAALAAALPGLNDHPRDADLLTVVSEARLMTGDASSAVAAARTLAQVKPEMTSFQILVRAARAADDRRALHDGLEKIAEVDPENLDAHLGLAQLALADRDTLSAREHMNAAVALAPDEPRVIHMETRTRLALDPNDGVEYLRGKVESMKEPSTAMVNLLATAERRVAPDQARDRLVTWTDKHPNDTRSLVLLSMWQIEDQRYDDARGVLERLLANMPDSWVSHNNLAYVLMQAGDLDGALEHITQARVHGGDQPELLDTEGQIRLRMHDAAMAEQLFRQAASQTSRPAHRLNLAEALVELERDDDARQILEQLQQSRADEAEQERARALLARLKE